MDIVDKAIRNWKLHGLALLFVIIAELIGAKKYQLGPGLIFLDSQLLCFAMGEQWVSKKRNILAL
ncbi:MAG: hypothetical protein LUC51_03785, partial [Cloacibacillus porcorum]|nr:hypothetical protein [Cloacibacillus porcorum]